MDTDNARNLACHRAAQSVWDKRGWSGVTIEERLGPWLASAAVLERVENYLRSGIDFVYLQAPLTPGG